MATWLGPERFRAQLEALARRDEALGREQEALCEELEALCSLLEEKQCRCERNDVRQRAVRDCIARLERLGDRVGILEAGPAAEAQLLQEVEELLREPVSEYDDEKGQLQSEKLPSEEKGSQIQLEEGQRPRQPVEEKQPQPVEEPQLLPVEEPQLQPVEEPQLQPVEEPQLQPVEEPQRLPVEEPQLQPVEERQQETPKEVPMLPDEEPMDCEWDVPETAKFLCDVWETPAAEEPHLNQEEEHQLGRGDEPQQPQESQQVYQQSDKNKNKVLAHLRRHTATLQEVQLHKANWKQLQQMAKMPQLRRLDLQGFVPPSGRSPREMGFVPKKWRGHVEWLRVDGLPGRVVRALLYPLRNTLQELDIRAGVAEERRGRPVPPLHNLKRLRTLRLTSNAGELHSSAACSEQLAALRATLPSDCSVVCSTCAI